MCGIGRAGSYDSYNEDLCAHILDLASTRSAMVPFTPGASSVIHDCCPIAHVTYMDARAWA